MSSSTGASETLIPGLPDDLAALILASLPPSHAARLRSTSRAWSAFLAARALIPLRRRLRLPPRVLLCLFPADPSLASPCLFDPAAPAWALLPPLPCSPQLYGLSNFVPVAAGPRLFVLGGSNFDARSYPLGHPRPSAAAHRLDLASPSHSLAWDHLPDMLAPRGSFACAADPTDRIIVAGGGSRHAMFPSHGTRMSSVELYDEASGTGWSPMEALPKCRAGCVGFFVRRPHEEQKEEVEEEEFWVMGGYGDYRTVSGVVPADVYYKDAVVLGLKSGRWREIGDMWDDGERQKLGPIAVIHGEDGDAPGIFMLDRNDILKYDFDLNRWFKESSLRRKIPTDDSCCFAALDGGLYVLTAVSHCADSSDLRRLPRKRHTLEVQIYDPKKKKWRVLITSPPFQQPIDFKFAVSCTIQL